MIENKKMVKCKDLLKNVKNEEVRKWLLQNIGCEEVEERMYFSDEKGNSIDQLFSIFNGRQQDEMHNKSRIDSINKGTFDEQIKGGVYNVFMPDKNTYFHASIASDLTKQTLEILQHIKEVADENKLKLEDLVPFKQMDNGKYGTKKNFLMLAIAKKYDNDELVVNDIPKMTRADYEKRKKSIEICMEHNIFTKEQIKKLNEDLEKEFAQGGKKITHKEYHKEAYQQHDAELIKWLIENAPDGCLQQKDGEDYNVIDYALMKMDKDILNQLLQKDNEKNLELLKNSKLLKEIYCNKFNYEEASEMVKKRYGVTQAIANKSDWENQKKYVLEVLDTYIRKEPQMTAQNNLENVPGKGHKINFVVKE